VALPDKIACQRAIKTKEEIERIKRANDGSSDAHIAMWQFSKPNETYEFQLEAEFIAASTKRNLRELGYPCIVGSGKNAAILHYEENSALCKEKEIVLVDAGAECEGYTADITRCFPTDGKFTEDAKLLYNVVLDVQIDAIERYTNCALWADIARKAKLKTIEGLQKKLGVVNADADLNEALEAGISEVFLPHALGHYLGLQVHDVGPNAGTPLPVVLEVGNVITCEPGVYFVEALYEKALANEKQRKFLNRENIERFAKVGGVRIEDNIWVTERGPVNLTRCPKTVEDVEAACASA
jgi:Xaa-Pro dipeptidase